MERTYLVTWSIEIDADSVEGAIDRAWETFDEQSTRVSAMPPIFVCEGQAFEGDKRSPERDPEK